eukprot:1848282-Rhodomonas_salina.1
MREVLPDRTVVDAAEHGKQSSMLSAPSSSLYVPLGHGRHCSALRDSLYVPAGHDSHRVQSSATQCDPAAQSTQSCAKAVYPPLLCPDRVGNGRLNVRSVTLQASGARLAAIVCRLNDVGPYWASGALLHIMRELPLRRSSRRVDQGIPRRTVL